jgi:hypothetical protein
VSSFAFGRKPPINVRANIVAWQNDEAAPSSSNPWLTQIGQTEDQTLLERLSKVISEKCTERLLFWHQTEGSWRTQKGI